MSICSAAVRRRTIAGLVATAIVMPVALATAQNGRPLSGRVFDATGAALPGVTVTLGEGAAARTAVTAPDGGYTFDGVAPGAHVVEIKVPAFRAFRDTVTLAAPTDWLVDVTMALGTVTESIVVTSPRGASPAASAPTASAPGPTRVRVGGNVRPPRKLKDVKPIYPVAMREAGRGAQVRLEAAIGTDGKVAHLRPLPGVVHPDFVAAASDAVAQWEFSPTLLNGSPVMVEMTITIAFRLE